jgi:hypothetical protein
LNDLERLERCFDVQPSPNSFEGHHTLRAYNLLAPVRCTTHPGTSRFSRRDDALIRLLISSLSSIAILPGETAQPSTRTIS